MNSSPLDLLDGLTYAVCPVGPAEPAAVAQHARWIAAGGHADMGYLANYPDVRANPALLLPGAKSMVIVAFPYFNREPFQLPIALYARGRDYHEVVRERLTPLGEALGGEYRICVDSAPLRERYWAERAGLGRIGRNNQLIVPGLGSYCFIGTMLTTADLPERRPFADLPDPCGDCQRCVTACPGHALHPDGAALTAARCISYLTIEGRMPLPDHLRGHFGCDICQQVCPHNQGIPTTALPEFLPRPELAALSPADFAALSNSALRRLTAHSPLARSRHLKHK